MAAAPVLDELLMMSIEQGQYYGTDKVGAWLWEQLAAPCVVDDLCARLTALYQVDAETCRKDVLDFLQESLDEGLLSLLPAS